MNELTVKQLRANPKNILNLEDPNKYYCEFYRFTRGPGNMMWLRTWKGSEIDTSEPGPNLVFEGVSIFDGPLQWASANFCVAAYDEWLQLINKLRWFRNLQAEEMTEFYDAFHLVTVQSANYMIRILAESIATLDDTTLLYRMFGR